MAVPLSKNQIVIHLLARTWGDRLGRTRLTKALFLADYHARRRLGRAITTYDYKYHDHGPWTNQILEDVEALEAVGGLKEHMYIGLKGVGHSYSALGDADYSRLTPNETFILHAVVDRCATGDLERLLREVYDTPPMRSAQAIGKGVRIPMEQFSETPRGVSSADLEHAERELDEGLGEDLETVLDGL